LTTKIEFYDRLREHIPEPAARLIAEEVPVESDVATKADLAVAVAQVNGSIESLRSSMFRWMLVFFLPLWVGVYGTLIAILLKGP
jgi:hypothetical protein